MIWLAAATSSDPALGILASLLAMTVLWYHRSRFVPFWLPAEEWHALERPELDPSTRLTVVGPAEPAAVVEPVPGPEPELLATAQLHGQLLEMQGQLEAAMHEFTAAAEAEWKTLEHQLIELHARYQVVRGQLVDVAGEPARSPCELAAPVRWPPEPCQAPEEPPLELSGSGWSEPDAQGLRSRASADDPPTFEYLGAPPRPDQPGSADNPRPYYRERRLPGFVEIARGVVAGKRLLITECARWVEGGLASLSQGEPLALEPGGKLYGAAPAELGALETVLWTLPLELRQQLEGVMLGDDLGGRTDWQGRYRADADGALVSHAALFEPGRLALRADLLSQPRKLARVLRAALGESQVGLESGQSSDGYRWIEL
ncbi:hypothetical protein DYH09_28895 [bacterium CPR1]|nr:hypothetical protein [bacterium CPR1]